MNGRMPIIGHAHFLLRIPTRHLTFGSLVPCFCFKGCISSLYKFCTYLLSHSAKYKNLRSETVNGSTIKAMAYLQL